MPEMTIVFENLPEVQKAFDNVGGKIKDGELIKRAALSVERQAKINASGRPGPRVQTGRLRSSITTEILSNDAARVGTNVVYAPFLEFGTSKMPAYPFLFRSLEQQKDQLKDIVATYGKEIGEAWGK